MNRAYRSKGSVQFPLSSDEYVDPSHGLCSYIPFRDPIYIVSDVYFDITIFIPYLTNITRAKQN